MTVLAAFLFGVAVTTLAAIRLHIRWADEHGYRKVRLEATRVDVLYRDKDHNERLARRWERRAVEARAHIGDLTVQLARERTRRPRRKPYERFVYGAGRITRTRTTAEARAS